MDKIDRIPRPGGFYRHFKDKLYQVLAVAEHTETGEQLVVYQALYGDYRIYARPLKMFISEVDHEKYPEAVQRYRFEEVDMRAEGIEKSGQEAEDQVSPWMERFLDAEGYEAQLEALNQMWGRVRQRELDSIYLILDIGHMEGDEDSQLRGIMGHLETRMRYDGSRLRRPGH